MREEYDLCTRFYSAPKKIVKIIGRKKIQNIIKKLINTAGTKSKLIEVNKTTDQIIEKYEIDLLEIKILYKKYVFKNPITIANVFFFKSIEDIVFLSKIL